MNRRTTIKTTAFALAATSLSSAQQDDRIGKLGGDEFEKLNAEAAKEVAAIRTGKDPLSEDDRMLANQAALGGMMQLQASELAVKYARSRDVRAIAEAEVAEQKGVARKLQEIATAGDMSLPEELDEAGRVTLAKLKAETGEIDRTYLELSGVQGHERLQATMKKVVSQAEDPALVALAKAALPLIETHLQVSRDELAGLGPDLEPPVTP